MPSPELQYGTTAGPDPGWVSALPPDQSLAYSRPYSSVILMCMNRGHSVRAFMLIKVRGNQVLLAVPGELLIPSQLLLYPNRPLEVHLFYIFILNYFYLFTV